MYLRPPSASEEARINDWIKVRQSGIRYYLSLGDQRIVDKNFIIRPKAEFEVSLFVLVNYSSAAIVVKLKLILCDCVIGVFILSFTCVLSKCFYIQLFMSFLGNKLCDSFFNR